MNRAEALFLEIAEFMVKHGDKVDTCRWVIGTVTFADMPQSPAGPFQHLEVGGSIGVFRNPRARPPQPLIDFRIGDAALMEQWFTAFKGCARDVPHGTDAPEKPDPKTLALGALVKAVFALKHIARLSDENAMKDHALETLAEIRELGFHI